jgi:hypothetical protein
MCTMYPIIFALLLSASWLLPGNVPDYQRFEFNTTHTIRNLFWIDQNCDSYQDLFLMCGDVNQREPRELLIFLQSKDGFKNNPDFTIQFPKNAIAFDVGDIGSLSQGPAIVFCDGQGLSYFPWQKDKFDCHPRRLCTLPSIYELPSLAAPIHVALFKQNQSEKKQLLCLPDYHQLHLLAAWLPGGIEQNHPISLSIMSTLSSDYEAETDDYDPVTCSQRLLLRVPKLFFGRFDTDEFDDLAAVVKDRITVFPGLANGSFSPTAGFQTILNLSSQDEQGFIKPNFQIHLADANGDGLLDALVSNASMKTNRSSTKIYLFLNQSGKLGEKPDQVILFANTMGNNIDFKDVNQDKCIDLIIPSANMSLMQFIKILISQKLDYSKNIHLWKNGGYQQKPDISLSGQVRFNLENPNDLAGTFFYAGSDFNGDDRFDLLKSDSDKKYIAIFLGINSRELFEAKAARELQEEKVPSDIDCRDINSDKLADLSYRYDLKNCKQAVVWISQTGEPGK